MAPPLAPSPRPLPPPPAAIRSNIISGSLPVDSLARLLKVWTVCSSFAQLAKRSTETSINQSEHQSE